MDPLKLPSASLKSHVTKLSNGVKDKLNTTPKRVGAIIGGSVVVGAAIATSPIWISAGLLVAAGGLVGGAVGAGMSGVYLTYKRTKDAAEGLADSPEFQNAMEALSITKLIGKVFEKSLQNKVKSEFKSDFKKDMKAYHKGIKNEIKKMKESVKQAEEKDKSKVKVTSEINIEWKPTGRVKEMMNQYTSKYSDGELGEAKNYLSDKELKDFKKLKTTLDKLLKKYSSDNNLTEESINKAFYAYANKQERVDENKKPIKPGKYNASVGMEKLAKIELYMKLIEARSNAKTVIDHIKKLKDEKGFQIDFGKKESKTPLSPEQKKNYEKYIKPIEKFLIKNGKGNWNNFDSKKLTFKDCKEIMAHKEKLNINIEPHIDFSDDSGYLL